MKLSFARPTALLFTVAALAIAVFVGAKTVEAAACCGASTGTGSVSGSYPGDIRSFQYEMNFGTCPNPGGTLKVKYDSGTHWILGESTLRVGSDAVYDVGRGNYVQCFCPTNGTAEKNNVMNAVQTNWLRAADISKEHQGYLLANGWKYVASGKDFDLADEPYLGFNVPYSCGTISCLPGPTTAVTLPAGRSMTPLAVWTR